MGTQPWIVAGLSAMALAGVLAGCGSGTGPSANTADVVQGKRLFVERCGACHTLNRAATRGTVGPNLDAAFSQSRADGLKSSTIEGVVSYQIHYPARQGQMPAKIVTGQAADDVSAYVAKVAAVPGQDTGALATAVPTATQRTATAQNGTLQIDANATGQLAYDVSRATASPGRVTIDSRNSSSTPHDIAIQQGTNGPVLGTGRVVSNGGVSTVSADLRPGTYTFFCTVPGHRQAGMVGTITVK